jgi:hypothetical protein
MGAVGLLGGREKEFRWPGGGFFPVGFSTVQAGTGGRETVGERAIRFAGCGLWLG